jgi:hypothetical protein
MLETNRVRLRLPQPILNAPEVAQLFSHPLASFLSKESPFPQDQSTVEFPYHSYEDVPYRGGSARRIRFHRFLTGREAGGVKPIFGVTAWACFPRNLLTASDIRSQGHHDPRRERRLRARTRVPSQGT